MDANERIKDDLRREGLEKLKRGDWLDRFRYFYITRLKKHAIFRFLRTVYASKIAQTLSLVFFYVFLATPFLIYIFGCIVVAMWKTRNDDWL